MTKSAVIWRAGARRRFREAAAAAAQSGWRVLLDGRALSSPRGRELLLPTAALAEAVAAEWNALGERIDPEMLGLTGLVNAAVDLVAGREEEVRAEMRAWIDGDLLCYRAPFPESLQKLQAEHWDPPLAALAESLGVGFTVAEGVLPQTQPQALHEAVAAVLARHDAWHLAGLRALAGAAHSLALALAHRLCGWPIEKVVAAALLDETFQAGQWGVDAEAEARRKALAQDMRTAARFLKLLERP